MANEMIRVKWAIRISLIFIIGAAIGIFVSRAFLPERKKIYPMIISFAVLAIAVITLLHCSCMFKDANTTKSNEEGAQTEILDISVKEGSQEQETTV